MGIEKDINQHVFTSEYQKGIVNLIYTNNWLEEKIKEIIGKEDLTMQQFNILRILRGNHGPLSTMQIRNRMLDKMSDTSRIVDRMVIKGYVTKAISQNDKRLVDVVITDEGITVLKKLDVFQEQLDNTIGNLSTEETKKLNSLLDKIRQ